LIIGEQILRTYGIGWRINCNELLTGTAKKQNPNYDVSVKKNS
jgi:hypothetical protein